MDMRKLRLRTYTLMISVLLWGVLLGGVVYSHMVFFPVYLSNLPDSAAVVNGPYGLNEARFWLTIHPLLVLSLVVALIANWRERTKRFLIGSTLIVYLVVLVVSALFFVPELIAFHDSPITAGDWQPRADRWWNLSLLRGTTLFIFAIPLLFARARSEASNGGN